MRNKYIRFFVSSTFADMKIERNLLQEIFDELSVSYSKNGWQIESVDLRWGITKEAGLDNKTMQICLTELKRCQDLSPKPNFIILMGDRYGWIPLPELISQKDIEPDRFCKKEQDLFYDWYDLDTNYTEPHYVLKPRSGKYEDIEYWTEYVEKPLGNLFKSCNFAGYGISATEQEIQAGALKVSDASEHVIAYIRQINGCTRVLEGETNEKWLKQKNLQDKVRAKLDDNNVFSIDNLTNDEYGTESFCHFFKDNMRQKIVDIIDKIVRECESEEEKSDLLTEEINRHIEIAKRETAEFVGREGVLDYIDAYLNDTHSSQALWIKAPSGVGKSALLAKIATLYKRSHHVVCRFCGQTPYSLMSDNLLESVWAELRCLDKSHTYNINGCPYSVLVAGKLHNFLSNRPLLLIIDAINQLHDEKDIMASMRWLPNEGLKKNVKVIFSSTDELRYDITRPYIKQYFLPQMGQDAMDMIINCLHRNGRKLCDGQMDTVKELVNHSECSAIYLKVLSQYLTKLPSWQPMVEIPKELTGLVKLELSSILNGGHYNRLFVDKILSLLCQERIGLTASEMLNIVSADEKVYKSIEEDSFHQIEGHRIPVVIWSRLYYELSSFIRYSYTKVGQVMTIYHTALKDEFIKLFLPSHKDKAEIAYELYRYFAQRDISQDLHANSEMVYQGYSASCHYSYFDTTLFNEIRYQLFDKLTDAHYIIQKNLHFPIQFREETDLLSSLFSQETKNVLRRIKYEITEVSKDCSTNQKYENYLKALPSTFCLRQIADKSLDIPVMENTLADLGCFANVIHVINNIGTSPVMREDGKMVAYLTDNRHRIVLCKLPMNEVTSYTLKEEIKSIDFDDSFRYNTIQTDNILIVYDNQEDKTLLRLCTRDIIWYSMCKKKNILVLGKKDGFYLYDFEGNVESWLVPTISGMLSPTGIYLWLIHQDHTIHRFDMDCEILSFGKAHTNKLGKSDICSCSEEWMACSGGEIVYHYKEKGHNCYSRFNLQMQNDVYFCEDENTIVTIIDGLCKEYMLQKHENEFELRCNRETHIEDVLSISRSFNYALVKTQGIAYVCDFKKEMARFTPLAGGNTGINNLACNNKGDEIILSVGVNHGGRPGDENQATLRITDNVQYEWIPPFKGTNHNYVSATAMSPDGRLTAAASVNKDCEIVLYDNLKGRPVINLQTKNNYCVAMEFSQDGKYLIAHSGDYFATLPPTIYLISAEGKLLLETELNGDYWSSKNHIKISCDNNFVFSAGEFKNVGIFSLVQKRQLFTGTDFIFYACRPYEGISVKEVGFVVYIPFAHSVLATDSSGRVHILDLECERAMGTSIYGYPIAASPSGEHIYFLRDGILTMNDWPLNREGTILMDGVRWVVPALDDEHIFITLDDYTILLYNVKTRRILQEAFFGTAIFQKICRTGLVAAFEGEGKIALFKPDDIYKVNTPASTFFVRKWNIEGNMMEEPTAICPMCGGEIEFTSQIQRVFDNNPTERRLGYRERPALLGHYCPHCKAELRFNPYIV